MQNLENLFDGNSGITPVSQEEHARLRELLQDIDWDDPKERKVIADTVVKKLQEEIKTEDITQFYATVDRFGVGETPEYQFSKGLKAYVHEPGTYAPRSTMVQRTITINTELISVHPEFEISQLEGGRYGSIASIKGSAKEELIGRKNAILWTTLVNSIPSTTSDGNYKSFASTASNGIKKNFLVSGIDYVDDKSRVKAIVGRRSLLGFINEIDGYSETFKTKIDTSGGTLLGGFRGIPIVALHQYTDGYDVNRINATDLMIIAQDTTRLAVTEDLRSLEEINVDDRMWHWHISEKYGAAVFFPEKNWRINVT